MRTSLGARRVPRYSAGVVLLLTASLAVGSPALDALDDGDALWFSGRRARGAQAWRLARREADAADEHALAAMARIRLLRAGSTWSVLWHGPRIDAALAACDPRDAWCRLARVDFHLLGSRTLGARPALGVRLLEVVDELGGRQAVRRRLFLGDGTVELTGDDGLTRAVEAGFVPDRGSFVLGGGIVAGPAVGIGVAAHLSHPDVLRRGIALTADGFLATQGQGLAFRAETSGRFGVVAAGVGQRVRWGTVDGWVPVTTWIGRLGGAIRQGAFRVELGAQVRLEQEPLEDGVQQWTGHGVWGALRIDDRTWRDDRPAGLLALLEAEVTPAALGSYSRFGQVLDLRGYATPGRGVLTGRVRVEGMLGEGVPEIRRPTVGGANVFRGARPGLLRGDAVAVVGAELRHPIIGPIWAAGFVEGALIQADPHVGGGAGLRYVLPPRARNTVRLDLAVSDVGWQVHAAWGEAW